MIRGPLLDGVALPFEGGAPGPGPGIPRDAQRTSAFASGSNGFVRSASEYR